MKNSLDNTETDIVEEETEPLNIHENEVKPRSNLKGWHKPVLQKEYKKEPKAVKENAFDTIAKFLNEDDPNELAMFIKIA